MVQLEQRTDTISLTFEKNHSGCCMDNGLHRAQITGRETGKETVAIIMVRYDSGLVVAEFVRGGWIF